MNIGKTKCPCGCGLDITPMMRLTLENIANAVYLRTKKKIVITSAARCQEWNKKIGGAKNSAHLLGLAADISTPDSHTRYIILDAAMKMGINRIGWSRDKKFLHIDIAKDSLHPKEVAWDY